MQRNKTRPNSELIEFWRRHSPRNYFIDSLHYAVSCSFLNLHTFSPPRYSSCIPGCSQVCSIKAIQSDTLGMRTLHAHGQKPNRGFAILTGRMTRWRGQALRQRSGRAASSRKDKRDVCLVIAALGSNHGFGVFAYCSSLIDPTIALLAQYISVLFAEAVFSVYSVFITASKKRENA